MPSSDVDVDSILISLKYLGPFQIIQFMLSNIGGLIIYANNLLYVFIALLPTFRCNDLTDSQLLTYNISEGGNEVEYSQCHVLIRLQKYPNVTAEPLILDCPNGYNYTTPLEKSIISQGYLISTCTVITEMFPAKKRNLMTGLSSLIFSFTILIFEVAVYLTRHKSWRVLVITCASFSVYGFFELIFYKESLRWLFAKGKVTRAKEMIQYAAKLNRVDFDQTWQIALREIGTEYETENTELVESAMKEHKHSTRAEEKTFEIKETTKLQEELKDELVEIKNQNTTSSSVTSSSKWIGIIMIIQYSYTRSISIIIMFNWLVITVTYHSFFLLSETLSGNLYLNFLFLCLIEISSCVIYWPAIVRFGHKRPLVTAIFSGSVFLIIAAILKGFGGSSQEMDDCFMVFFMLAMLGIGSAFGGLYLYSPELYPTEVRSVGLGMCSASARIGNMMAPFARMLATYSAWAPSTLFGTGCIIGSILLLWGLPETFKKRLPQTIQELKHIEKSKKLMALEAKV